MNRFVAREVGRQLARNRVARRARYGLGDRVLRTLMAPATFGFFLAAYLLIDLAVINLEGWTQRLAPYATELPPDMHSQALDAVKSVPSYLLGAQIGLLGVVSLALALVTLIAQRDDASTDVRVYYHESLFFGIASSGLALSAVLAAQFLWPLQALFHWFGGGSASPVFELALVALHTVWLLINLWAVAHFISVTFLFVQRPARERMRERYTANVVMPRELSDRLRHHLYMAAGTRVDPHAPGAYFGLSLGADGTIELADEFAADTALANVHMAIVRWVVARWAKRCNYPQGKQANTLAGAPRLFFTPMLDQPMHGRVAWCRRRGGVPLTQIERRALRIAFRFREHRDEA